MRPGSYEGTLSSDTVSHSGELRSQETEVLHIRQPNVHLRSGSA